MDATLKALLDAGKTPEAIYQDCLNIVKEQNEQRARKQEKEKKVAEARAKFITAIDNYFYTVTGERMSAETVNGLEKDLKDIEETADNLPCLKYNALKKDKSIQALFDMLHDLW